MGIRDFIIASAEVLHRLNLAICVLLMSVLFIAQITIVVLRYAFGVGFLELQDLASYSFAMLVVLSIPVAIRLDRHVRVDIFRSRQQYKTQKNFDRFGILLLLFPVFAMTLYIVMPQVIYSWQILEAGIETGGLPGYFLIKTALPAACFLMLLQGAAILLKEKPRSSNGDNIAGDHHGK